MNYPVEIVLDEKVMKEGLPEIEKLERGEPNGFNRCIDTLMTHMIPQPQTNEDRDLSLGHRDLTQEHSLPS